MLSDGDESRLERQEANLDFWGTTRLTLARQLEVCCSEGERWETSTLCLEVQLLNVRNDREKRP